MQNLFLRAFGKSKRLADEPLAAGHLNVRRYQPGMPVWRALGGVTEIEPEGLRHVAGNDETAVLIHTRDAAAYAAGALEAKRAKEDGWRQMEDCNTRIVVFGEAAGTARYVAEALAR